jgi:membrane-associated phospholipid phosphatase
VELRATHAATPNPVPSTFHNDRLRAPQLPPSNGRRWLRPALIVGWACALVLTCIARGIPTTDRISLGCWILTGLLAATVGTRRGGWRVIRDWLPVLVLLYLYDLSRGVADTLGMPVHVTEPLSADVAMFGVLPTQWLQDRLYDSAEVRWWDVAAAFVYFSHFFVALGIAAALYLRSRLQWVRFVSRLLALSLAGLVTYVLYPAAPPWLAAEAGQGPPVSRISARGWEEVGLHSATRLVEIGQVSVNAVAAVPSLHAAFALLVAVFLWPLVHSTWVRLLLAAYPLTMGLTLVYCGEHYVVDVLLGWLYVVGVLALVSYAERWLAWRRGQRKRGSLPWDLDATRTSASPATPGRPWSSTKGSSGAS